MTSTQHALRKQIHHALSTVMDPELHVSITDMGLIYGIDIDKNNHVTIIMTLTTIGCPLFDVIQEDIIQSIKNTTNIEHIAIDLTFDPPWSIDMMSENARAELGLE